MSGVVMPAAARMSTISVETTARSKICWIANSRSALLFPEPSADFTRAARTVLEEADFIADVAGLIACGGQGECLGKREHCILIAAVFAALAVLAGFLSRGVVLVTKYPFDRFGEHDEALMRRASQASRIIEAVVHGLHDLVLLKQHGNRFGLIDPGLTLIGTGILAESVFKVLGDPDVIDNEASGLVAENPVYPGNGLHQSVALHGLVDIHRMHRRRVEPRSATYPGRS